jgi:hypothetical protein
MIQYHLHHAAYLEVCRCYKAIYESEGVQDDEKRWMPVRVGVPMPAPTRACVCACRLGCACAHAHCMHSSANSCTPFF